MNFLDVIILVVFNLFLLVAPAAFVILSQREAKKKRDLKRWRDAMNKIRA